MSLKVLVHRKNWCFAYVADFRIVVLEWSQQMTFCAPFQVFLDEFDVAFLFESIGALRRARGAGISLFYEQHISSLEAVL